MQNSPKCQICSEGHLQKKKKFRMSGPVVTIGYILLIPCVIGMLLGVLLLLASGGIADQTTSELDEKFRESLIEAEISEETVAKAFNPEGLTTADHEALTEEQRTVFVDAELTRNAGKLGAGAGSFVAGGFAVFLFIASLIGGLVGWLLVMRKKVLQCTSCRAVIAAS